MEDLRRFICEEEAMGTVEVVLIAAVLIGLGLMFKKTAIEFVRSHLEQFGDSEIEIKLIEETKLGD